jgi:hypothetical protein
VDVFDVLAEPAVKLVLRGCEAAHRGLEVRCFDRDVAGRRALDPHLLPCDAGALARSLMLGASIPVRAHDARASRSASVLPGSIGAAKAMVCMAVSSLVRSARAALDRDAGIGPGVAARSHAMVAGQFVNPKLLDT